VTVTVAVVSFNSRDRIAACLESLRGDADVWVVDNASTDGTAELVRERFPWVTLVASPENLGFGRAVNLVAERTARQMAATYEWMARARGVPLTRATAGIGWAAHTLRAAVRRGPARDRARYWRAIHAGGLRSR
jgi:glycosyltransferase involved in cell wall biosynthesis